MNSPILCPVCNQPSTKHYLTVKDYSVSQETFQLLRCSSCAFIQTTPIPADLSRYYESAQYISHTNKATGIVDILYKFARTQTTRWKTNLITQYNHHATKTLLDYGCGTGAFLAHAQKKGWAINGVEPSDAPRKIASTQTNHDIAASLNDLAPHTYNIITLWHVLEHIEALHQTLHALTTRLNQNGTIFIAVPNHESLDAHHYQEHWAAYDTPRHLWHFSRNNMKQLLDHHELKIVNIIPMKLDALYVSILSEKYKTGASSINLPILLRGLTQGLRSNMSAQATREYSSLIYIARK